MTMGIPENHALCRLFRGAVEKAFNGFRRLYEPRVSSHLANGLLAEFVHMDAVYKLQSSAGQRLEDLSDMLAVSSQPEGPERRLEVDRYIGDFTLFMVGFFPASVQHQRMFAPDPMISRVGQVLVQFSRPLDYYAAEGRNAYGRAAETARLFDPESRSTFKQLAHRFEDYLGVLETVRRFLWDLPEVQEMEDFLKE